MTDSPGPTWRKSTYSGTTGNCTEVTTHQGLVLIRDSKNPHATHIRMRPQAFARLITQLRGAPTS